MFRRLVRSPITWWFVALAGAALTFVSAVLVVAAMLGAAFTCALPHACSDDTGLPFIPRVEVVLAVGLVLVAVGAFGHVLARRSEPRAGDPSAR